MGLKTKRKVIRVGNSRAITLPPVAQGEYASIAANRVMLVDPRAEISEDDLLEFLEKFVEPAFWRWYLEKHGRAQKESIEPQHGAEVKA